MGSGQSTQSRSSAEDLSHLLAERFATKCFTPLELTHFKDNFFSRAIDHAGLKYWSEKVLSDFLGIPDGDGDTDIDADHGGGGGGDATQPRTHSSPLDAGPVVFRMVSYLGAFPFQNSLAPSVLTFEALVKVVVLLTGRYGRVLRRARKDRIRLLFGSLADVGRRHIEPSDKPGVAAASGGFAVDKPSNQDGAPDGNYASDAPDDNNDNDDDGDDLALAALESLDAIEVFKHDRRADKTSLYEASISRDTLQRLLMLLVVIAPLQPLGSAAALTGNLTDDRMQAVQTQVDSILAAFYTENGQKGEKEDGAGVSYKPFAETVSRSLPHLFDPLTPLFEHFLFSENLNLSRKRAPGAAAAAAASPPPPAATPAAAPAVPPSVLLRGAFETAILNQSVLAHLSFFLSTTAAVPNMFWSGVRLHPVFSTAAHGASLTSFAHNVLTWQSGSLLVIQGRPRTPPTSASGSSSSNGITLGAYLPAPWKSTSSSSAFSAHDVADIAGDGGGRDASSLPCLFQLSPHHLVLPGNPSPSVQRPSMPAAYFSTHTGVAIGCEIPPSTSRGKHPVPVAHGAGSIIIDTSLETAEFYVSSVVSTSGVFMSASYGSGSGSGSSSSSSSSKAQPDKVEIDIYNLEVWGWIPDRDASASSGRALPAGGAGPGAVELQRAQWDFEAREAERRRNLSLKFGGGESAAVNARWLLETAGLIGDQTGVGRSGGSV